MNWRKLNIGAKVFHVDNVEAEVVEVWSDHLIVENNDMKLWVDDSNCSEFREV